MHHIYTIYTLYVHAVVEFLRLEDQRSITISSRLTLSLFALKRCSRTWKLTCTTWPAAGAGKNRLLRHFAPSAVAWRAPECGPEDAVWTCTCISLQPSAFGLHVRTSRIHHTHYIHPICTIYTLYTHYIHTICTIYTLNSSAARGAHVLNGGGGGGWWLVGWASIDHPRSLILGVLYSVKPRTGW